MRSTPPVGHRPPGGPNQRGGEVPRVGATRPLVIGGGSATVQQVLALAAAAGVEPELVTDAAQAGSRWRTAPMVIVADDRARSVAELALPRRAEVFLVGEPSALPTLETWSGPIGAAVVVLPDAAAWLTTTVADVAGRARAGGRILSVLAGSGGVGSSTLAAATAVGAAERGLATLLVDLDPAGGGIDLLMGAEDQPGWRWPRLAQARGHVADLADHLPRAADVAVLAAGREPGARPAIAVDAIRSVLTSGARHHGVVVVDLPRTSGPAALEALRCSDRVLVVTGAEVRAIAATRLLLDRLRADGLDPVVAVRRSRRGLPGHLVADALDASLATVVLDDPSVLRSEATGEPPGRARRSAIGRAAAALLDDLDGSP